MNDNNSFQAECVSDQTQAIQNSLVFHIITFFNIVHRIQHNLLSLGNTKRFKSLI